MVKPGDEASNITLLNRGRSRVMVSDRARRAQLTLGSRPERTSTQPCEMPQNDDRLQRL
jgi:hypothetical protein